MNNFTIIWDWNGTLLNDVDISVLCMNKMLKKRGLNLLDKEAYRDTFTFPIQNFYTVIGFDLNREPLKELATEFHGLFKSQVENMELFPEVKSKLESFENSGFNQIILSAMEHSALLQQVDNKGITSYFSEIIGLNNVLAASKIDNALNYIKDNNLSPSNCILIGDTFHDYEVAQEIGCKSILINNGNQELTTLSFSADTKILGSLKELNIKEEVFIN